jgi:hypothetical protein
MASDPNEVHVETDAARAGSTPGTVRWILAIGLFAAIVLLSIIWITGAATQSDSEENVSVEARSQDLAEDRAARDDTDSIVGEDADRIEAPAATDTVPSGDATVEN